jgi:hypothetical protein
MTPGLLVVGAVGVEPTWLLTVSLSSWCVCQFHHTPTIFSYDVRIVRCEYSERSIVELCFSFRIRFILVGTAHTDFPSKTFARWTIMYVVPEDETPKTTSPLKHNVPEMAEAEGFEPPSVLPALVFKTSDAAVRPCFQKWRMRGIVIIPLRPASVASLLLSS